MCFVVGKPSAVEINVKSANQVVPPKFPKVQKCTKFSSLSSWRVKGRSGHETIQNKDCQPHVLSGSSHIDQSRQFLKETSKAKYC